MAQGIPPAAAMASYRRSSLPFASLQTLTMLPILRRAVAPSPVAVSPCCFQRCSLPFACTEPNTRHSRMHNAQLRRQMVPQQAQQAPRPQAKATTRPQQWLKASPRPQQWLVLGVQGCRLTGFKPLKTPKMPRRPFACIALCRSGVHASGTPAGKKPPQGHSNGSRHPPGRSNGFL